MYEVYKVIRHEKSDTFLLHGEFSTRRQAVRVAAEVRSQKYQDGSRVGSAVYSGKQLVQPLM